jgi:hypothetical protein
LILFGAELLLLFSPNVLLEHVLNGVAFAGEFGVGGGDFVLSEDLKFEERGEGGREAEFQGIVDGEEVVGVGGGKILRERKVDCGSGGEGLAGKDVGFADASAGGVEEEGEGGG